MTSDALKVWLAQAPCEICGARPGRHPETGVQVKNGHRDFCAYVPLVERAVVTRAANVIRQAAQGALGGVLGASLGQAAGLGRHAWTQQLQQMGYQQQLASIAETMGERSIPFQPRSTPRMGDNEAWLDRRVNEIRVKLT